MTPTTDLSVSPALREPKKQPTPAKRRIPVAGLLRSLGSRLLRSLLLFGAVTLTVFGLSALIPGDPAVSLAGEGATPESIAAIREQLGLSKPWFEQYFSWMNGVVHGDLGTSFFYHTPVSGLLMGRLPVTLSLALFAIIAAVLFGILAGMLAATRRGRLADKITTVLSTVGIATPNFWVGMILLILFSLNWRVFPAVGYTPITTNAVAWFMHLVLPGVALAAAAGAELQRQTRSSVSEILSQDYIRTARAQGLTRRRVLWQRALKNGAPPLATVVGLQAAVLLGGSVVVEKVFSIPGLGTLAIDSVTLKDLPVLQGVVLLNACFVIIINFATDIIYTVLNPKVRV
ncbi:ABC transporter permease [Arthrobacter sp. 35W]|uniref:ABC transporter permease n=1 Tax=Arthrobacter sp. 35W TaxID=1132441 RepID=UPI0012DF0761|nr:ABC transporter permease [Arthrobacter sp. 35W]